MRKYIVFVAFVIFVFADDKYTTKYDNIDIDEILKSDRLLKNYIDCVMDRGKCTPDGTELKSKLLKGHEKQEGFFFVSLNTTKEEHHYRHHHQSSINPTGERNALAKP